MMKLKQSACITLLETMSADEAADLAFSTKVTEILQRRAQEYRASTAYKSTLRPRGSTNQRVTPQAPVPTAVQPVAKKVAPKKVTPTKPLPKKLSVSAREQLVADWAKKNVRPSMIVEMKGTRDKHGVRLVVELRGDQVVCRRYAKIDSALISRFSGRRIIQLGNTPYVELNDVTSHQLGKLSAVFDRVGNNLYRRTLVLA